MGDVGAAEEMDVMCRSLRLVVVVVVVVQKVLQQGPRGCSGCHGALESELRVSQTVMCPVNSLLWDSPCGPPLPRLPNS